MPFIKWKHGKNTAVSHTAVSFSLKYRHQCTTSDTCNLNIGACIYSHDIMWKNLQKIVGF